MARKGLKYACFAVGTYTEGASPTYASGSVFAAAMRADISWQHSSASVAANNNARYLNDKGLTGGSITLDVATMDAAAQKLVLGLVEKEGVLYDTAADAPIGGFGYVTTEEADDGTDYYIGWHIPKVQFAMNSDNANTRGEQVEFQSPTIEGDVMGVDITGVDYTVFRAQKKFDTEAAAFAWVKTQLSIT